MEIPTIESTADYFDCMDYYWNSLGVQGSPLVL
jgi:hypothetical protein